MSFPRSVALVFLAAVSLFAPARAQVELIAGFNFGQFLQPGEPALDGVSFERVGSIPGNWSATVSPGPEDTGDYKVQNNLDTVFSAGDAMLWFDGSNGSSAWTGASVSVVERGGLDAVNAQLVNGEPMYAGDDRNLHLQLNAGAGSGDTFAVTLSTLGYADFDPAAFGQPNDFNFTFSAYNASGASASIEWFLGDRSLGVTTADAGNGNFQAFNLDLASEFFGQSKATLVARVVGDIVIDHIQINGVKAAPATFTRQPESATVVAGSDASFTVVVGGAANPTYRWRFNGVNLADGAGVSGSGTATLSLSAVTPARAGSYTVLVNNNGAVAESAAGVLSVHVLPVFTLQPHSATANPGEEVRFEAEATGTPAPGYRWFKDGRPLVDDARISGSATASLRITALVAGDEGVYTVRAENAAGGLDSGAAALVITDASVAPSIQQQPAATAAVLGAQAVFRVVASGAPAPAYQWFKGEEPLADGGPFSGATTATLRVTPGSLGDGGLYRVVVSNSAGSVRSDAASLAVHTLPGIPAGSGPQGGWAKLGDSFTFTVAAEGVPAPTYQWFKDGLPLLGQTSASLVLDDLTDADAGAYTVVVTNAAGSVESSPALLQVSTPARIAVQPLGRLVGAGSDVALSVTAVGYPAPAFQWFKNGEAIPDATEAVLNLGAVTLASAGDYTVAVSNLGGGETSQVARLEVAASVRRGTAAQTYAPGTRVSLDSGFAPDAGYRFVWLRNGSVVRGANASTYLIADGRGADSGSYSVRVYSAGGRLLLTVAVARVSFSVAGTYDALLRSSEDQSPVGVLRLSVAANGTYSGKLTHADGRAYSLRGRFTFPESPALGVASATLTRGGGLAVLKLTLALDARDSSLELGLFEGEAVEPVSVGEGERRASSTVEWRGAYSLRLDPMDPAEGQPSTAATLNAKIAAGGSMSLSGRLADGTRVTANVPGSVARAYAVFIQLYSKKGHLGGLLRLEAVEGGYLADRGSGGSFSWVRPSSSGQAAFDLELDPLLFVP